jgi:MFS family permease
MRGPRLAARGFIMAAMTLPTRDPGAAAPGGIRRALLAGVTRNVIALGLVSFFTDISSELLVYLIPLYLANVLAATPTIIGVVEGVTESASAFLKLGSGWLSDRLGRRKTLVLTGYSTSVAAKALYLLATAWPVVLAARLGDRIGKGIRTAPRDALIADSTPPESRGRAFGLHRALDTAGALVGVTGAAIVVTLLQGDAATLGGDTFRALVLVALVPGVIALVVLGLAVRDVPAPPKPAIVAVPAGPEALSAEHPTGPEATSAALPTERRSLHQRLGAFPSAFWLFVGASALFTLGNSSDAFISLRSQSLGIAVRDILLMVIAFNFTNVIVAWPVGALSDRVGRRGLIAVAWSIYAVTYLGLAIAAPGFPIVVLWALYGVYYGVSDAVGKALVADVVPPAQRATGYGILNMVTGPGASAGLDPRWAALGWRRAACPVLVRGGVRCGCGRAAGLHQPAIARGLTGS